MSKVEQDDPAMNAPSMTGWRLWSLIALVVLFPIVFHPWWLLVVSLATFGSLLWLLMPRKRTSK
jgi:hypothetical protein